MTYAIGQLVYGIDLTPRSYSHDPLKAIRAEISDACEEEAKGFGSAYSGGGDPPMWFGINLDYEVSECDEIDCEELRTKLEVTPELQTAFQSLLEETLADDSFADSLKEALKTTSPKMLLLWGSS